MRCPKKNRSLTKKPKQTAEMKRKNQVYVWKEIKNNPNIYCWLPIAKKKARLSNIDVDTEDVNIQDIPPPIAYEDLLIQIAEEAIESRRKKSIKRLKSGNISEQFLVSVDDPGKYKIVKKFVQRKNLKVYGGIAINSYLPREEKIYMAKDIPDYDVFSPDPWNDAIELADELYKAGYKYVEARAGIHKGTYKVMANFWPAADISYLPPKEYAKVATKTVNGIKIVEPFKLFESMYKEFSEPYSNPSRWPKVAEREKLLAKWAKPFDKKFNCSPDLFTNKNIKPKHISLLNEAYRFIRNRKLLFTGSFAYNIYIELGGGSQRVLADHYQVLTENAQKEILELMDILLKIYPHLETTTTFYPSRELNNIVYRIYAVLDNNYEEICAFIHLTSCTPYRYLKKQYVVSIDYLKYELFDTSVFGDSKQTILDAKCKLKYLTQIQNNYYRTNNITELDKSPFQRFITTCKGPYGHNVKIEILNRWLDRNEREKRIIRKWTKTARISIKPKEKISPECRNKTRELCKYPCIWNKFIGRCQDLVYVYRPTDRTAKYN
jgi:hypothetical protein